MVGRAKKPTTRVFLLPSVLAISLMLSACQKETTTSEESASDSTEVNDALDSVASENLTSNVSPTSDPVRSTMSNAEAQLIDTLSRHRWTLDSVTDANHQSVTEFANINSQVTLVFNEHQGQNTLSYSVGCNTISAAYQLQGHTLTIDEGMSTKMSCSELDSAENTLSTLMLGNSELKVTQSDSPVLTQFTSDNATLVWSGRLTPQAKYNSKGEAVFWAVNAKKVDCEMNNNKQCLQIKPVTYDNQGIKTHEGKWRVFSGEIDGYHHDGTHEEVLRLQRYQLGTSELLMNDEPLESDTNDDAYAYVLDAVIESSVAE